MNSTNSTSRILVTGATGYVGGRLVPRLLEAGYQVRVLVRDPTRLQGRDWMTEVEIAVGDALRPQTLATAMTDVDVAYYLIHSMLDREDFQQRDVVAAGNFAQAAQEAGVKRLIYLGGLGDPQSELSPHLRSRQQTGETLRQAGLPVTEFRAAVIVGSGSLSFEMVRHLSERLPVMICPQWVFTRIQPIAIRNVLDYLVAALETPASADQIIEIGGADVLTYADMILKYAAVRGLRRWMLPVPVLTPALSSYWVHWTTPLPASIARPLIEGVRNEVIVRDPRARQLFPDIALLDYESAVRAALVRLEEGQIETVWSDALASSQGDLKPVILAQQEGLILEHRQRLVEASPAVVYETFTGIGGRRGWFYANWAWELRGVLDRLVGGVGLRRGRRDPEEVRVGDALDFWRVEANEPPRLLRLRAEMKVPGLAWLQFEAKPPEAQSPPDDQTVLSQTAFFAPKGLFGLLYWYALYPIHQLIFSGLIEAIARRSEARQRGQALPTDTLPWWRWLPLSNRLNLTAWLILMTSLIAVLMGIWWRVRSPNTP